MELKLVQKIQVCIYLLPIFFVESCLLLSYQIPREGFKVAFGFFFLIYMKRVEIGINDSSFARFAILDSLDKAKVVFGFF